ncbi:hypothetical protein EQV77_00935 [Halobacillus fulvus]|nr:hypothetical protein EQV77_00935 [Halobacillus fulvus]
MVEYSIEAELKANVRKFKNAINTAKRVTKKFKQESETIKDTVLRADSKPLQRNLKKAKKLMDDFTRRKSDKKVDADVSEFFRKAALVSQKARSLARDKIVIPIEARVNRFQNTISRIANSIQALGTVSSNTFRGIGLMVSSGIVPILASLTGLIGGIGVQLGVLSGGALGLASSMGAAGAGAGVLAPFLVTLGQDLGKLDQIGRQTQQFKELSQSTKDALNALDGFQLAYGKLTVQLRDPVYSAFSKYLEAGTRILERLSPMAMAVAKSFDELGASLLENLNADDVQKNLDWLIHGAPGAFQNWGKIIGNLVVSIGNLMRAFNPLAISMEHGLLKMTESFRKWTDGLSESERFNKFIEYVKANGPTLLSVIGNITVGLVEMFAAFAPMATKMMTRFQGMTESFREWASTLSQNQAFQNFINYVQENSPRVTALIGNIISFLINLGVALAPLGSKVLSVVNSFLSWTNSMMQTHPVISQIISALTVIVGAMIAMIPILAATRAAFGGLGTSLLNLFTKMGGGLAIFAKLKVAFLAITGPVGIAVAAVVGLVATFVVMYNRVDWFRQMVDTTWASIRTAFSASLSFIQNVVSTVISAVVSFAGSQLEKFRAFWDRNGNQITQIVKANFSMIQQYINVVMNVIKGIFQIAWPILANTVKVTWNLIETIISIGMDIILGFIEGGLAILRGDWEGAWQAIERIGRNIWTNIESFFANIDLTQMGRDIIQGLLNGIGSMFGAIRTMVSKAASLVPDWLKKKLGIASPSKVTTQLGEWTGEGMVRGVDKTLPKLAKKAREMADRITPSKKDMSINPALDFRSSKIRSSLNQLKKNSSAQVQSAINTKVEFYERQPANFQFNLGSREYRGFVNDITDEQQRELDLKDEFA